MNYGWEVNEEPWAQSHAPGAAFSNVAKEVARDTISDKEKSVVQEAEDKIGKYTEQLTKLGNSQRWIDRIEAAREIPDPQKMSDTLAEIERDKAAVPNIETELNQAILKEIKLMFPCAIKLLAAVIKRLDNELSKIKGDQIRQDSFWGLATLDSNNWLVFGIQRLRSGLESNLESLKSNDPGQISICRYVLSESGVLQPRARVQSP